MARPNHDPQHLAALQDYYYRETRSRPVVLPSLVRLEGRPASGAANRRRPTGRA